jgi:hypothetical protein
MIEADASKITDVITGDPEMLRAVEGFLDAVLGLDDVDLDELLSDMAEAIARSGPFRNHEHMVVVVKRGMLLALHALALSRLPSQGQA